MTRQDLLKQINQIRIGSKWCIKHKQDVSYYINIGTMTLPPHEHITVDMVSLTFDNLMVSISHRSGYTAMYNSTKFLETFTEIKYPEVKLKDFVNHTELFRVMKNKFNINLTPHYDSSARLIQMNDATFETIIYLEHNEMIEKIISKKETDYVKHGKGSEHRTYGLKDKRDNTTL